MARAGTPSRVSVVIPALNDVRSLRRCLASLSLQTSPPDEIVVVDNGSTDGTGAEAVRWGATVLRIEERGIPVASAAGFDAATGDILARLDADCVPSRFWVERIREQWREDPGLDAVTGPARFIDGPVPLRRPLAALYLGAYFGLVGVALGHIPLFGSNCAVRRTSWLRVSHQVHRHDTMMHDDLDLSVHLGPRARIRYTGRLVMGISMRPFADPRAMILRGRRGWHSLAAHWPAELPWRRWSDGRGDAIRLE